MNKIYAYLFTAVLVLLSGFLVTNAEGNSAPAQFTTLQAEAKAEAEEVRKKRQVITAINEMKDETAHWQTFRNRVYGEVFGLNQEQLAKLEALRATYDKKIEKQLAPLNANKGHSAKASVVKDSISKYRILVQEFDRKVSQIIGEDNFRSLLQWRDYYNQELRVSTIKESKISNLW